MLASVLSYGLLGINGYPVQVEVDISGGLPAYETVGLPDAAVRESKERVRAAIKNSGFTYPVSRVTINLAPADTRKEGSVYDLPIAVGILAATEQLTARGDVMLLGELALDGAIRPIQGVLPMAIDAVKRGITTIVLPTQNADEAAYIEGLNVFPAATLKDVAAVLKDSSARSIKPYPTKRWENSAVAYPFDFCEIRGQQGAKRAAEVAAAGGHNILLLGTPGSGKTMLARSMPSILPDFTFAESLEVTKIHSICGALKSSEGIVHSRPFRSPHHTLSTASLIGGGQKAMPGEISLAHYGVLFLDEFPEFRKDALEALRQPLEDGVVNIARVSANASYPAQFMLVAAMNPCPCGNFGSRVNQCRCNPQQIQRYLGRVSGPLLDRIDLHVEMTEVCYGEISSRTTQAESSASIRERVNRARQMQTKRYDGHGIHFNAQLTNQLITKFCALSDAAQSLLQQAFTALSLSARAYGRILKVSRTIADLEGSETIEQAHVAEAIQYRNLDRKYWGK